jgi:transcriptional regulator with XRE-family HTH domain
MPNQHSSDRTVGDRVKEARTEAGMSQKELSRLAGLTQPTISSLEPNESNTSGAIARIANALQVNALWLETGLGEPKLGRRDYRRTHSDGSQESVPEFEIKVLPSRGSCGGAMAGEMDVDAIQELIGPVIKDQRFFERFHTAPEDTFAIIGDGQGMAKMIEHGDTVVFSRNYERLVSGLVYAFDTFVGPRIKRLHRRADGSVILSCDSPDKNRYPDEIYLESEVEALHCLGVHLYREG